MTSRFSTPGSRRRHPLPRAAWILGAAMLCLSCSDATRGPKITVERYLGGVQQRHHRALAQLWAPYRFSVAGKTEAEEAAALEAFRLQIEEANAGFTQAKDDGIIPEDPMGIAMFRALGMGKGAFSVPIDAGIVEGSDGNEAWVRTRINTNLGNMNLDHLPTGVRIYLMGYPFGKLQMISVGYDEVEDHSLLGSVDIEWRLVRSTPETPSPTGWLVEGFEVDLHSAVQWLPPSRRRR